MQTQLRHVVCHAAAAVAEQKDSAAEQPDRTPFERLGVDSRLVAQLRSQDIVEPTAVQAASIPRVLQGGNVAMQCYTGSGKTLAYLLPVLTAAIARAEAEAQQATGVKSKQQQQQWGTLQAVVLAPSRELAMQIVRVAQGLLPAGARGAVQQCIGGANPHRQAQALKDNRPVLVVGTPGRLAELSREGVLQTHRTPALVLDEVDQLLAPHFRADLSRILEHTGKRLDGRRQTVLVSATLTPAVLAAASQWCPDLEPVVVGSMPQDIAEAPAADWLQSAGLPAAQQPQWGWGADARQAAERDQLQQASSAEAAAALPPQISHLHVVSQPHRRVDMLRRCIHAIGAQRCLVFMNFQQRLKDTQFKLEASGMKVACLHGDLDKMQRQAVLSKFVAGQYRALIVSDIAARGLDVADCDAVFNLELPSSAAAYAHRAGRTARAGRDGTVVSIVTPGEAFVVDKLARKLRIEVPEADVSGGSVAIRD